MTDRLVYVDDSLRNPLALSGQSGIMEQRNRMEYHAMKSCNGI